LSARHACRSASRWAGDTASECWVVTSLGAFDGGIIGPRNLLEGTSEVLQAPSEIAPGGTLDFALGLDVGSPYLCSPPWAQLELDLACGIRGI
jgi:hypothetical protein